MATRRPRDIGTAVESAVVRAIRPLGFPLAERRAMRGALDAGDITGTPGCAWSVKGGQMAKTASDGLVQTWLDECMTQVANAGADVGILVVQRRGIGEANAGRWWAIMPGWQYVDLVDPHSPFRADRYGDDRPIRQTVVQVCDLLVHAGYGTAPAPTDLVILGAGDG